MAKIFQSSFFWFVVIGALIFWADAQFNQEQDLIVVDDRVLLRISTLWQQQMDRPPTDEELRNLVENWIDEEMLFREAKRLSLDEEDVIVKRRLIQKMHFLVEEAEVTEPDEAALRSYFEGKQEDYRLPDRYTFSHVFYRAEPDAQIVAAVNDGSGNDWRSEGDPTMQRPTFVQQSQRQIASEFGKTFADSLVQLESSDTWQGPLTSEFGWHLVRLESLDPSAVPSFEAIQHLVLNDYLFDARAQAKSEQLDTLRSRYEVVWQTD